MIYFRILLNIFKLQKKNEKGNIVPNINICIEIRKCNRKIPFLSQIKKPSAEKDSTLLISSFLKKKYNNFL